MIKSIKSIIISRNSKSEIPLNDPLGIRLALTDTKYEIDCYVNSDNLFRDLTKLINYVSSSTPLDMNFKIRRFGYNKDDVMVSVESSLLEEVSMITVINAEDISSNDVVHKPIYYIGSRGDLILLLWRIKNNVFPDTDIPAI